MVQGRSLEMWNILTCHSVSNRVAIPVTSLANNLGLRDKKSSLEGARAPYVFPRYFDLPK